MKKNKKWSFYETPCKVRREARKLIYLRYFSWEVNDIYDIKQKL